MMSYEVFKKVIAERIEDFMPPGYENYKVKMSKMKKVNRTLDCMNLMPPKDREIKEPTVIPNIYINEMYDEFKVCQDLNSVLTKIAAIIYNTDKFMRPDIPQLDFRGCTNAIVINLINTERNKELLEDIPHREVLDLSIIYRIMMHQERGEYATILVTNSLLKDIGMSEEELYLIAKENTAYIFPTTVKSMDEIFMEIIKFKTGGDEEHVKKISNLIEKTNMYVISNEIGINGAANMIFEEELFALAEKMGSNFFILPSSIHEVIAISDEIADYEHLTRMVSDVNNEVVRAEEILSDDVYYYDREIRSISFALGVN